MGDQKQGRRTSSEIEDYILRMKEARPDRSYAQLAEFVKDRYGEKVDKSTVGNILRRLGWGTGTHTQIDRGSEPKEDSEQAERSDHWPALVAD